MEIEEIYSVKEVAQILGMSTLQIRGYINDGRLKALNISRGKIRPVWKVKRSQLDLFLGGETK